MSAVRMSAMKKSTAPAKGAAPKKSAESKASKSLVKPNKSNQKKTPTSKSAAKKSQGHFDFTKSNMDLLICELYGPNSKKLTKQQLEKRKKLEVYLVQQLEKGDKKKRGSSKKGDDDDESDYDDESDFDDDNDDGSDCGSSDSYTSDDNISGDYYTTQSEDDDFGSEETASATESCDSSPGRALKAKLSKFVVKKSKAPQAGGAGKAQKTNNNKKPTAVQSKMKVKTERKVAGKPSTTSRKSVTTKTTKKTK